MPPKHYYTTSIVLNMRAKYSIVWQCSFFVMVWRNANKFILMNLQILYQNLLNSIIIPLLHYQTLIRLFLGVTGKIFDQTEIRFVPFEIIIHHSSVKHLDFQWFQNLCTIWKNTFLIKIYLPLHFLIKKLHFISLFTMHFREKTKL